MKLPFLLLFLFGIAAPIYSQDNTTIHLDFMQVDSMQITTSAFSWGIGKYAPREKIRSPATAVLKECQMVTLFAKAPVIPATRLAGRHKQMARSVRFGSKRQIMVPAGRYSLTGHIFLRTNSSVEAGASTEPAVRRRISYARRLKSQWNYTRTPRTSIQIAKPNSLKVMGKVKIISMVAS